MGALLGSSLFRANIILIKTKSDHLPRGPAILESKGRLLLLHAAVHRAPWRRQVRTLTAPHPLRSFKLISDLLPIPASHLPMVPPGSGQRAQLGGHKQIETTDVAGCEGVWWGRGYRDYLSAQQPGCS